MFQKGLSPILIILMIAITLGAYIIYQNQSKPTPSQQTIQPTVAPMQQASPSPQNNTVASLTTENGADLENIKYTLPTGWKAEITNRKDALGRHTLYISPEVGPGLLAIHAYNYPNNIGLREYYCKLTNFCIEGTSYFTQIQIGNISGYEAQALDNSGGGSEYFGAKGNKFYIISKIRDITSTSDEFNKHFKQVLDSLVF